MSHQALHLRKIRDFGERIGDTVQFIKFNWTRLLGLYAVFVIPFLLTGIILGANSIGDFFTSFSGDPRSITGLMGGKMLLAMLMFLIAGASYSTVVYLYMDHYDKTNGEKHTIQQVASDFPKALLFTIGYTFLLILMMLPVFGLLALGFFAMKAQAVMLILLIPVLFVFFLLAMVYFLTLYPVNIIERGSFGSAIPATFKLLRGRWWFSVGYIIILTIIYYFFAMAISTMLNLIFGLTAINMMDAEKNAGMAKTYAYVFGLSTLIQQIFYLLIFVGNGIHYYSIHEEKMGIGLEQEISNIGLGSKNTEHDEVW